MNGKRSSSLLSKILLVVGGLLALGAAYWFITNMLAPIQAPLSAPSQRKAVEFDTRLDVSKDERFTMLRQLAPTEVVTGQVGRPNPFVPVPPPVTATTTATSTEGAATATEPVVPTP